MTIEYFEGKEKPFIVYAHSEGYEADERYHKRRKEVARFKNLTESLREVYSIAYFVNI